MCSIAKLVRQTLTLQKYEVWDIVILQRLGDRSTQQDKAGFRVSEDPPCCLLVAADGLGGHRGGEEAASAAVSAILESWEKHPGTDEADLRRYFDEARSEVARVSAEFANEARTTCVVVVLGEKQACWTHLGDSRLYVFRQGDTIYKTKDHSVARLMVKMGELSEEEARTGPEQGRLYKSLGSEVTQEYQILTAATTVNDGFLLCTDGFWGHVSEAEMSEAMQACDLEQALGILVDLAVVRANGSSDNVTVCAVRPALKARKGH